MPRSFYDRHTLTVARELLGKVLVVRKNRQLVSGRIVETEAYRAEDPASHSARGLTPRSSVMFGPPGVAYVYFIYGMHEMLNFVCEKNGDPGAVLIRAIEPIAGEATMLKRRFSPNRRNLTSGPGKLCSAFGIGMSDNGRALDEPGFYVYDYGYRPLKIGVSARIGISQGTDRLWRFFEEGNEFVSKVPRAKAAAGRITSP